MNRYALALIGSALVVVAATALLPVTQPMPDFSQAGRTSDPAASLVRPPAGEKFREVQWADLLPGGWTPSSQTSGNQDLSKLSDADALATALLARMHETLDSAPGNNVMDGASVRIPGYVVPLEQSKGLLTEFLLVPYFGACIHTPPPPANQIVHFVLANPSKSFRSMDTVWASGTLRVTRGESSMGVSGYRMDAALIDAYVAPGPR